MNEVNRARWKLMGGIFLVIILIHIIIISCIASNDRTAGDTAVTPPSPPATQVTPGQPAVVTPPVPGQTAVKEEKPRGFWSRLFGGGGKKGEATKTEPEVVAPPRVWRFKQPSANPLFGQPFDYIGARTGDFPAKEVPGSSGATSGILVDMDTRKVLWEKNSAKPLPVASMVKMMTVLLAFEKMEENAAISLDSPVRISPEVLKVARTGIVWLDPRETLPLSDLMKAATIRSANDAAVQIALFFSGTQDTFIRDMNARALELGMTGTNFLSPCGLPDKVKGNSVSTSRDMVILGERLLEYPQYLEWAGTKLDYIRVDGQKTMLNATNRLINPQWPGVDGLKTGYIRDSGYCLTFSAIRDGRRIVGCVTGFPSARNGRDPFVRKLIDWGYKQIQQPAAPQPQTQRHGR